MKYKCKQYCVWVLLFVSLSICSLHANNCEEALRLIDEADLYFDDDNTLRLAIDRYTVAAELLKSNECREWASNWNYCKRSIAYAYHYMGNMDSSRIVVLQAIQEIGPEKPIQVGKLYNALGFILNENAQYFDAITYYDKAIKTHENGFSIHGAGQASEYLYKPLGSIYTRIGDYEKALYHFQKALDSISVGYDINHVNTHIEIGITHQSLGDYDNALQAYEQARNILSQATDLEPAVGAITLGMILQSKGGALLQMGQLGKALSNIRLSINTIENTPQLPSYYRDWANSYLAGSYQALGEANLALENFNGAKTALFKAISIQKNELPNPSRREISKAELSLAELNYEQQNYDLAYEYVHSALARVLPGYSMEQLKENPKAEDFYPESVIMEALELKGDFLLEDYTRDAQLGNLIKVKETYLLAAEMATLLRESYSYRSSKLDLIKSTFIINEKLMNVLHLLWFEYDQKDAFPTAFYVSEQSKAVLLNEKLQGDQFLQSSGIPDSLVAKEKGMRAELTELGNSLTELRLNGMSVKDDDYKRLNKELDNLKAAYNNFQDELKMQFKEYDQHLQSIKGIDIGAIKTKLLKTNTTLVEYFYDEEENELYILSLGKKDRFEKRKLEGEELMSFILKLRDIETIKNIGAEQAYFETFVQESYALFRQLLDGIIKSEEKENLIIVPDGILGYLPFDVLLKSESIPEMGNYASLDYLLRTKSIRAILSLTTSFNLEKNNDKVEFAGDYLGIAPDYTNSSLNNVRYGVENIEKIAKLFSKPELRTGKDATISSFSELWPKYRVVQFYGHALAIDTIPNASFLAFTLNPDNLSISDAPIAFAETLSSELGLTRSELEQVLFANSIFNSNLYNELIVLSACETGLGKYQKGEGIASIATAFQNAGCPNLLMSLWEVEDNSTAQLMEVFFANLKAGLPKDVALQKAKLAFLDNPQNYVKSHPVFWGGFTLLGDAQPIFSNNTWWKVLLLVGFGLLGVFLLWRFLLKRG
ncbi:MAG: CHAT domain-containing protein [Bacteroidota bacterium]